MSNNDFSLRAKYRVLVVEDSYLLAESAKDALTAAGYAVVGTADYIIPRLPDGSSATPAHIAVGSLVTTDLVRTIDNVASASIVILDTHFPSLGSSSR